MHNNKEDSKLHLQTTTYFLILDQNWWENVGISQNFI